MLSRKLFVAKWNLAISFLVLGLKIGGYLVTQSSAIYSDALETLVNVLTAIVALLVVKFISKPADEDHPYGHGKVEFFSAAFEGGLIFFAGVSIFLESFRSYQAHQGIAHIPEGTIFILLASIVNLIMAMWLKRVGNNEKSETLLASSSHLMSDVYTTVGVIVGLGLVHFTGLTWLDTFISALIALHLMYESYQILRRSVSGLTDEMDQETLNLLAASIRSHLSPGIINIHNLRAIRSGSFHHIDAHVIVPEFWDVGKVHKVTHDFEKKVVNDYPYDGEFAFHLDPCGQNYCSRCDVPDCHLRKQSFKEPFSFSKDLMIKGVNTSFAE